MSDAINFDVVLPYDPEVVKHANELDIARYAVRREIEVLALPSEAKPIVFRCRVLSRDQRRQVRELGSVHRQRELAFRYGVVEIRNLPRHGGITESLLLSRKRSGDPLEDADLDALHVGDHDIEDVGAAILARSFLAHGVPPECVVPDSSRHAVLAVLFRHAEQSKVAPTPTGESSP